MASEIRKGLKIVFADDVERLVYPLTIRQLKKFLEAIKGLKTEAGTLDLSEEDIDKMVEAAAIALEKDFPEVTVNRDGLQDILDMRSFNQLMMAAMGADPNE